jgi:hypothetical protein
MCCIIFVAVFSQTACVVNKSLPDAPAYCKDLPEKPIKAPLGDFFKYTMNPVNYCYDNPGLPPCYYFNYWVPWMDEYHRNDLSITGTPKKPTDKGKYRLECCAKNDSHPLNCQPFYVSVFDKKQPVERIEPASQSFPYTGGNNTVKVFSFTNWSTVSLQPKVIGNKEYALYYHQWFNQNVVFG